MVPGSRKVRMRVRQARNDLIDFQQIRPSQAVFTFPDHRWEGDSQGTVTRSRPERFGIQVGPRVS